MRKKLAQKADSLSQFNKVGEGFLKSLVAGGRTIMDQKVPVLCSMAGGVIGTIVGAFVAAPAALPGAAWLGTLTVGGMILGGLLFNGKDGLSEAHDAYLEEQRIARIDRKIDALMGRMKQLKQEKAPALMIQNLQRQCETLILDAANFRSDRGAYVQQQPVRIELIQHAALPERKKASKDDDVVDATTTE